MSIGPVLSDCIAAGARWLADHPARSMRSEDCASWRAPRAPAWLVAISVLYSWCSRPRLSSGDAGQFVSRRLYLGEVLAALLAAMDAANVLIPRTSTR